MIGTDPSLDLPSGSDPLALIVAKVVTALEALADSIAQKATPAGLAITSALSIGGNSLTAVGSVQFSQGNVPSTPGSFYYYGGEFYGIDATGVVQFTSNGLVNVLGSGAIVGDYGQPGVSASVYYDDASGEYRFWKSPTSGVYGDLVANDLVLEGANGSVRFGVDASVNSARSITIKDLTHAGSSLLAFNSATSTIEDASGNTDAKTVGGVITFTSPIFATDYSHTSTFVASVPVDDGAIFTNCGTLGGYKVLSTGTNWSWWSKTHGTWGLRAGDRVKSIGTTVAVAHTGSYTISLYKMDSSGSVTLVQSKVIANSAGSFADVFAITSPTAIATGERWAVRVDGPVAADQLTECHVSYDHP